MSALLNVLWARKIIVLIAFLSALAGGGAVVLLSPPRYEGSARVLLNYTQPDPLTGEQVPSKMIEAYINSQIQFIRDYQVAIPAAEAMGMLDNVDYLDAYGAIQGERPPFPQWVASRILLGLNAVPVEDSSILEIRYRAADPEFAQAVADAVRSAYVGASVAARSTGSQEKAAALAQQSDKLQANMIALQREMANVERETGVMLQRGRRDIDTNRLRYLSRYAAGPQQPVAVAARPASEGRLVAAEADLVEALKTMGPAHPEVRRLAAERERWRAQVAMEAPYGEAVAQAVDQRTRATQALLEDQKSKVLSQRPVATQLRLLQDEVDRHAAEINDLNEAVIALRQLSTAKESTFTPVGAATFKPKPVFPNVPLIMVGSSVLGLLTGSLLAVLAELLGRRVRAPKDLSIASGAPVIGVVPRVRHSRLSGLPLPAVIGRQDADRKAA